ncbi:MAG: UDP-2,3-diacylglucosamine diphosphatase [Myxococcota bacterium]
MGKRIKIVISDFHIGSGHKKGAVNYYDEFIHDDLFAELLEHYSSGKHENEEVELIINGDFYDLIKVSVDGEFPDRITENIAVKKLKLCLDGHPKVTQALKKFAAKPGKSITYLPGNHDIDLLFPTAAELWKNAVATDESRERIKVVTDRDSLVLEGGIHIHHGHQFEANNAFNYKKPFVTKSITGRTLEKPFLTLPWGTLFLLKVIIPLKPERFYIDHIRPFKNYVRWGLIYDTLFTIKLLSKGIYYFLRTRLNLLTQPSIPLAQGFREMIDSIVFYPSLETFAFRILKRVRGVRTVIMGHDHYPRCRTFGDDKLYINTGTWVKMINLDAPNMGQSQQRPYAKIEYEDDSHPPLVTLLDWRGKYKISHPIWF